MEQLTLSDSHPMVRLDLDNQFVIIADGTGDVEIIAVDAEGYVMKSNFINIDELISTLEIARDHIAKVNVRDQSNPLLDRFNKMQDDPDLNLSG